MKRQKLLLKLGANVKVNDGKDLSQDAHAKDLESMGIEVISSHPFYLLDDDPIIVKTQVFHILYQLLKKQQIEGLKS